MERGAATASLASLKARIARIGGAGKARATVLPFGISRIDRRLPGGGVSFGALHEIIGSGFGAMHGAAAALFVAGMLARTKGPVLWCLNARDLFAPALSSVGLHPDRVIYAEPGDALLFDQRLWHAAAPNIAPSPRICLFYAYGYRWLRPDDYGTAPDEWLMKQCAQRRQLLGAAASQSGYYLPTSADLPLREWLEAGRRG